MNNELSVAQNVSVDLLVKKGFFVNKVETFEGDKWPTVFMSKRVKFGTLYAEVDANSLINGQTTEGFLKGLK